MVSDIVRAGLDSWWAPALAFGAGVVSCASPCVWPLLPGYISFISGGVAQESDRKPLVPILLFISGFTIVFALMGAFASTFVALFKGTSGQVIAGSFVVVMGVLIMLVALGKGPMSIYMERRPFLERARLGTFGAVPLGMAFAAGWTPCIGPVLAGILGVAAISGGTARGVFLLVWYSLGLGLPFLLIGLGITKATSAFDWVKRNYTPIALVSGSLMIFIGVAMATGVFTRWFNQLSRFSPGL